jgi:tetratricopeptide (TPR) repeat protein
MSQDQAVQFLQQGIAAAKAGQQDQARQLLQNAIRLDPGSETAWLWLSSVARDNKERVFCLRQLLQINPQNEMALKGLRSLGVSPGDKPDEPAKPTSTVPLPDAEKLSAAQQDIDAIIAATTTMADPYADIEWVHKERNRAGERAATMFNLAIRVVPVMVILCILGAGAIFVTQNPDAIAFAPTWTPSHTPTVTSTPTPGFTPTPSPTPELTYTPTPVIDPDLPAGSLDVEMTITPAYPSFREGRIMQEAVILMDDGQYSEALPTVAAVREELLDTSENPNPFYYEAVALVNMGDSERAERVLLDGIARLEEIGANTALLQAGLGYVYASMEDYSASNDAADEALAGDPNLPQPYITLVQNAIINGNYQEAASVISEGLDTNPGNVYLWILSGELNLRRGQPAEAQQDARVALHIDPTAEEAYLLRARADMDFGDYGLAVLHLQEYLFIYPGSIEGWTLLGDARSSERNYDLAIAAYSRALNTDEPEPAQIPALLARASLYSQRNQFVDALDDYDTILRIDEEMISAREGRARAAYQAARFGEAIDDLDQLLETFPERDDLRLLKAQALVDGANPRDEEAYTDALDDALNILAGNFPTSLPDYLQPDAYEYRARILFTQERYREALSDVDQALAKQESGSRHYWRGRIQEEQGEVEAAIREYEWVELWGKIYSYPFLPDVVSRLRSLQVEES